MARVPPAPHVNRGSHTPLSGVLCCSKSRGPGTARRSDTALAELWQVTAGTSKCCSILPSSSCVSPHSPDETRFHLGQRESGALKALFSCTAAQGTAPHCLRQPLRCTQEHQHQPRHPLKSGGQERGAASNRPEEGPFHPALLQGAAVTASLIHRGHAFPKNLMETSSVFANCE